jgi:hypothetical protein
MAGQADLGRDGADRLVVCGVPLVQADPGGDLIEHEGPDVGVAAAVGHVSCDVGQAAAGALGVRPGDGFGRDGGERGCRLLAPLLGDGPDAGRRGGIAGQLPGAGPLPARRAAGPDCRLEDQAGGEGGGPELAGGRAFQGLAAFQAERLTVSSRGPAVHPQVRADRAPRPTAQMTHDQPVFDDYLADRRIAGGAVRQRSRGPAHRRAAAPRSGQPTPVAAVIVSADMAGLRR